MSAGQPRADEPFEVIGVIDPSLLVQRWQAEFGIDVSASFSSIRQLRIIKGMNSGIVYFDPPVVGDEDLYRGLSKRAWYYPEDKWELRRSLADIRPGQKLLEVGCGRGAYVARAAARGADVLGVELNRDAVAYARGRGLNISDVNVYEAPAEWKQAFDVVSAFQVMEHVPDPVGFCKTLYTFVKPGGHLHIAVPNGAGFMAAADGLLDGPPHHVSRWTRQALQYVGQLVGADRTRVIVGPLEALHVDVYLDVLRRRFGRVAVNRFTRPIAKTLLLAGGRFAVAGHSLLAIYRASPVA